MPRRTDSNNPADWLFIALTDLEGLHRLATDEIAHAMCRSKLAEVLEKGIKAELIRAGWALEKTHDLGKLYELLERNNASLAATMGPLCDDLAEAYFADRYPGFDLEDADWPKLREQIKEVEALLVAVKANLAQSSS